MVISSARRSSSSARKATACSARDSPPSSESKSKRERRRSKARKRSRNCDTGGKRKAMWLSDTAGGSFAISRITSASCSGSCGASFRSGRGARGAGPRRKKRSRSSASRSASQPAASFIRRYSARRRASSSAASSGSSSASSAASSSNRPRAFSSSRAATSTRNSPQASRSSSSRSASRSMKRTTMPATSTSARSSSSLRISVSSRSKGPSKASRSSSSSRTIIATRLTAGADAALRHSHGRALRDDLLRARPVGRILLADELPPDEEGGGEDEDDDRDVRVQPEPKVLVRGVDAEQLLEEATEAVPGDVEREQRRPPDPEVAVDHEQHHHADDVPDELVQEGRVEGRVLDVRAAVRRVDLEPPRQVGRLPVELLVEPVTPAADALCEQQAGRDCVHEQADAVPGASDDPRAREDAEENPAPHAEAALPDGERRPPGVDRLHLAPARDVVVDPRADDPERDSPDGDAEDEIPVAAPLHPAVAGKGDAGRDREQEHDPVEMDRERADVDRAAMRRGNAREDAHRQKILPTAAKACLLQQNLQRELGRAAAGEQLDGDVEVDVVPQRQLGGRSGTVARQLELFGPPGLDQNGLVENFGVRRSHLI